MSTKYAGQVALNKLMQLVKNAIPTKVSQLTNDAGFITDADIPEGAAASTTAPLMDGTAAVGVSNAFARGDHVHPSDSSKLNISGGTISGDLTVNRDLYLSSDLYLSRDFFIGLTLAMVESDSNTLSLYGDNMAAVTLRNVATPTNNTDVANKAYVDGKAPYVVIATVNEDGTTATMSDTRDNIKARLDVGDPVVGYIHTADGLVLEADVAWGGASVEMEAFMRLNGNTWYATVSFSGTGTSAYFSSKTVADGVTSATVDEKIASAITGVYTPKGTVAFASLPTASAANLGWVYNISDAFTTTASFVEGAGYSYGAGTNVVCVDAGSGAYKWDVLAGTIDLTELTEAEVQTIWDSV